MTSKVEESKGKVEESKVEESGVNEFVGRYTGVCNVSRDDIVNVLTTFDEKMRNVQAPPELLQAKDDLVAYEKALTDAEEMPDGPMKDVMVNGSKGMIAETQAKIATLQEIDPAVVAMLETLYEHIWSKGKLPDMYKTKRGGGGTRTKSSGLDPSEGIHVKFNLGKDNRKRDTHDIDISADFILVGPNHPKVSDGGLNIPQNSVGVFTPGGLFLGRVITTEKSTTQIISEACAVAHSLNEGHVADIASSGYAAPSRFDVLETMPELKAGMVKAEQPKAGRAADTEKQPA